MSSTTTPRRSDRVPRRSELIARRPTRSSDSSPAAAMRAAQEKLKASRIAQQAVADLKALQEAKDLASHETAMAIYQEEEARHLHNEDDGESMPSHDNSEATIAPGSSQDAQDLAALKDNYEAQSFLIRTQPPAAKTTKKKVDLFDQDSSDAEVSDLDIVDATNLRKRRKAVNRPVDPDVEVPSANVPRTPSTSKIVLCMFPRPTHSFLNHCRLNARFFTADSEAYYELLEKDPKVLRIMKHTAYDSKWSCLEFQKQYNIINDHPELRKNAIEYVDYTCQAMRSSVMAHTRLYMHLFNLPAVGCANPTEAGRVTADNSQWLLEKMHYIFAELNVQTKKFNAQLPVQSDCFINVVADFYFSKRSKLDMEAFVEVMDKQAVPLSFLALVGACIGHGVGEYSGGHFEQKHFTMAAAGPYKEILARLLQYELDYPDLVWEWREKIFQAACVKANKMWLIKSTIPDDDEELTRAFAEAQAAAAARRRTGPR
ncbi:hypothetical protein CYLTODRAFT_121252 [Cylindrobasidium torrendii FP15055 ss-10]|uniref:DUF6532 domain-containing protein n=1 Tax=Cylindrobasidium torrendii FP15055 ss-10 TaxID=1314674 RepID=A0A0D7AZR6_9AGAR|nr:hypothetical protein CYLTODRAFT_121252 [Cylindrobasidium torrendii FP15055 ss-10]